MAVRNPKHDAGLWTIILAAGGSSRLGEPKQLIRAGVRPLISRVVTAAETVTPGRVVVVLGAHALRLRTVLARQHRATAVVGNPGWASGMAGSLRLGLSILPERARAALLVLVDQPAVGAASLERLVSAWSHRPGHPAAALFDGGLGAPAILPRRLWRAAARLSGDVGARAILRGNAAATTAVSLPEAAFDVDTPIDRERLMRGR